MIEPIIDPGAKCHRPIIVREIYPEGCQKNVHTEKNDGILDYADRETNQKEKYDVEYARKDPAKHHGQGISRPQSIVEIRRLFRFGL